MNYEEIIISFNYIVKYKHGIEATLIINKRWIYIGTKLILVYFIYCFILKHIVK